MNKKKLKRNLKKKFEPITDRYVFTDNRHPEKGIMSTILGCISVGSFVAAILLAYENGGQAELKYGVAAIVAAVFSVAGLCLGVMSRLEKDIYRLFPNLGIFLNSLGVVFTVVILVLGLI